MWSLNGKQHTVAGNTHTHRVCVYPTHLTTHRLLLENTAENLFFSAVSAAQVAGAGVGEPAGCQEPMDRLSWSLSSFFAPFKPTQQVFLFFKDDGAQSMVVCFFWLAYRKPQENTPLFVGGVGSLRRSYRAS